MFCLVPQQSCISLVPALKAVPVHCSSGSWFSAHLCVILCVEVVALTVQGVPEGVQPPVVTALSSSSLQLTWSEPTHPSGVVQQYHLNQTGAGTIFTHNGGPKGFTVTGKSLRLPSLYFTPLHIPKLPHVAFLPCKKRIQPPNAGTPF